MLEDHARRRLELVGADALLQAESGEGLDDVGDACKRRRVADRVGLVVAYELTCHGAEGLVVERPAVLGEGLAHRHLAALAHENPHIVLGYGGQAMVGQDVADGNLHVLGAVDQGAVEVVEDRVEAGGDEFLGICLHGPFSSMQRPRAHQRRRVGQGACQPSRGAPIWFALKRSGGPGRRRSDGTGR